MDIAINSSEIIFECLQEHGKGKFFPRTDGLRFEDQRAAMRAAYLESHPRINPEHRQAIEMASATPGMSREEVVAAWGLLDEDTRTVFGHVTDTVLATYAYFSGFRVGPPYTIYLKNDFVLGIRQTDELVAPHELELTMRLAEETEGLHFFYAAKEGRLIGSDVDQVHIDWDTLHHHLYRIESVVPHGFSQIERHLAEKGLLREYELACVRQGFDSWSAPDERRSLIALSILPYPVPRWTQSERQAAASAPPQLVNSGPIALPPSELMPENRGNLPPEEWFAHIAGGGQQIAAFLAGDGRIEMLKVERIRECVFRVAQVPLSIDDLAPYDQVEMEWLAGDVIPRFKRIVGRGGHRVIRAVVSDSSREQSIRRFAKLNAVDPKSYRYNEGVLAFTIVKSELDELAKEWLGYLSLTWVYTDTLTQD
ncbi:MAG TPA: DUF4265 domain-containing protein [Pyrinomonadaceae bacterium]|nr:DUF4265 domain-containing protein [Pyrinomonadaceae bacterium]